MKLFMAPRLDDQRGAESGIKRVIEAYEKYLPEKGVQFVSEDQAEVALIHAGATDVRTTLPLVCCNHGLYWTKDYHASEFEYVANARIVRQLRYAKEITVPSPWVAETFQRDMHINPTVLPHGIEWQNWKKGEDGGYVLWNKNRSGVDVCHAEIVKILAEKNKETKFLTTFAPAGSPENVKVTGVLQHELMQTTVQNASLYLSTTKETFGIGILEAMASGVPVLGYAHGGILQLVKHGVNGYLASPNNPDDLSEGIKYCLQYREQLGSNGREMVKDWTWEKAINILYEVLERASLIETPSVSVVIPCYKYAGLVDRAIKSVLVQTRKPESIIVVDDGSPNNDVEEVVKQFPEVKFIRQDNQGVAVARNTGINASNTKYIVCLDADDAIEPQFIETCLRALENDPSLYTAYTRLKAVSPNGRMEESRWPREYRFDEQIKKQNQVPTCCMFRKIMWERLGGYRQRYAPKGAGCEDAEFWLRAGAAGMRAEIVDDRPLFVYSMGTGQTYHDPDYGKIDWTVWHPYAKDLQHPFASMALPRKASHPVRQYDEPVVSFIVPVGPGHEKELFNALDSIESQSFRKWEAIVVNDTGKTDWKDYYLKAFPFVRWVDLPENKGAGYARNRGVDISRGSFLAFLDSDDWLYPEWLERHLLEWKKEEAIIYSDYVGKSHIDDISGLAPDLRSRIYRYENGEAVIGYRAADYDCERALRQPDENDVYLWCNVTVLIPKKWHDSIGGFDESMVTREDVDYHWRLARKGYCYTRIPEELFVYRFDTGKRRAAAFTDRQIADILLDYLKKKYAKDKPMGCACRGKQGPAPTMPKTLAQGVVQKSMNEDTDFVMALYLSPNKGSHSVYGAVEFNGQKMFYGYRQGGEKFLVHKEDIRLAPHLFRSLEGELGSIQGPIIEKEVPPPPLVIEEPKKKRGRPPKV